MVSTVTTTTITIVTSVTNVTTTSAAVVSEIAAFGLMAALTLIVFLSFQEITANGNNLLLRRLSRTANTAVVPLLFALAVTVAIRVAAVL